MKKSGIQILDDKFNELQALMSERSDMEQQHEQKLEQLKNRITMARSQVAMALAMLRKEPSGE